MPPIITVEENEEYIDRSLSYLYETAAPIPEQLLPPVYFRKEKKKLRLDQPSSNINESNYGSPKLKVKRRKKSTNGLIETRFSFRFRFVSYTCAKPT